MSFLFKPALEFARSRMLNQIEFTAHPRPSQLYSDSGPTHEELKKNILTEIPKEIDVSSPRKLFIRFHLTNANISTLVPTHTKHQLPVSGDTKPIARLPSLSLSLSLSFGACWLL
jgi:hypothetical protein